MRIVVLGGAGAIGYATVMDLVDSKVEEIVIADYNLEGAKQVADHFKGQKSKVSAQFVDANDHDSLVKAMKEADAVASTIGPFYKYGVKVLKAAIDAGVNFGDIDGDYDATRDSLELDDQAKRAGVTAIIGLGASPGITNILAKYGADKLDRVDEIHIRWAVLAESESARAGADSPGLASAYDWFHCLTGMVPTYRDGKWVDVRPGSEPEIVDFPPKLEVFQVGHAEPVTLPRYVEGVKIVTNKGGTIPAFLDKLILRLVDFGFVSTKPLKVKGVSITPRDFTSAFFLKLEDFASPEVLARIAEEIVGIKGGLRVDVVGEKDGEATRLVYRLVGAEEVTSAEATSTATGISLSIGAQMLARGDVKIKGVFAPEGCIDPERFLTQLKKRGKGYVYETVEKTHTL